MFQCHVNITIIIRDLAQPTDIDFCLHIPRCSYQTLSMAVYSGIKVKLFSVKNRSHARPDQVTEHKFTVLRFHCMKEQKIKQKHSWWSVILWRNPIKPTPGSHHSKLLRYQDAHEILYLYKNTTELRSICLKRG